MNIFIISIKENFKQDLKKIIIIIRSNLILGKIKLSSIFYNIVEYWVSNLRFDFKQPYY